MFICSVCNKGFPTGRALGGHMRGHSLKPNIVEKPKGTQSTPAPPLAQAPVAQAQEPSEAEQIRNYAKQGLGFEELTTKLGFKPSTVRQELAKIIVEQKTAEKSGEKPQTLPVVIKDGKGEMIAPEAVYQQLVANDGIGGEMDFRALMKWAAAIEMVQRMTQIRKGEAEAFAETVKPMLEMMEKSRQELDAAAARARESTMAIAEAAAAGAAARATMRIDERFNELKQQRPDIATVQDPMKGLMARTMEMMMNRMQSLLFGGQGGQVPPTPGLVDKRVQQQGG